jgi:hypothetical protein
MKMNEVDLAAVMTIVVLDSENADSSLPGVTPYNDLACHTLRRLMASISQLCTPPSSRSTFSADVAGTVELGQCESISYPEESFT